MRKDTLTLLMLGLLCGYFGGHEVTLRVRAYLAAKQQAAEQERQRHEADCREAFNKGFRQGLSVGRSEPRSSGHWSVITESGHIAVRFQTWADAATFARQLEAKGIAWHCFEEPNGRQLSRHEWLEMEGERKAACGE